ncbi:hypothetical protein [Sphingobacterium athyrii]|uniref:Uncharacterized protein n=1 Tax=Sphingobacterium athyrii TaxID=2152717 RepID=A0A363NWD7_9SPHI|nr:hypothetical protein [Sphingobacterium athyrii]PUV25126.1 hypothetical protein DCO56_09295 [Sphingobacterium athyrii]
MGVDLNMIDISDSRTVLDYVRSEQEKYKNTPIETMLKRYYKKLCDEGANLKMNFDKNNQSCAGASHQ